MLASFQVVDSAAEAFEIIRKTREHNKPSFELPIGKFSAKEATNLAHFPHYGGTRGGL